jgi:hypothetical protein
MPERQRPLREALAALLLACAALYALWLAGLAPLAPHHLAGERVGVGPVTWLDWPETFASLWSPAALALLAAPWWPRRRRLGLLAAGVALSIAWMLAIGRPQWWLYIYAYLAGAGLVAMGYLAHQALRGAGEARAGARYLVCGILLFIGFGVVTRTYLVYSSALAVPVLDWSALKLDVAAFGFSPSAWAVGLARASAFLRTGLSIAYEVLPFAMFAVFALEARDPGRLPFGLLRGLFACAFAAALLYALTPVAGPAYALMPAFPSRLGELLAGAPQWLNTPGGRFSPRNAFPSFHFCWALLAVVLAWRQHGALRAAFIAYAACIAAATLALGEHYLVDLVAAPPVLAAICALCIERLSWRAPERWRAVLGGLLFYAAWAILLRPAVAHAATGWPWLLAAWCALNVAAGAWWIRGLLRARREAA